MKYSHRNIIICTLLIICLFSTPTMAVTRVVQSVYTNKIRNMNSLQLGDNVVNVIGRENYETTSTNTSRYVKFVAPKTGTYVFDFDNLVQDDVESPAVTIGLEKATNKKTPWYKFKSVPYKYKGKKYYDFTLADDEWIDVSIDHSEYTTEEEINKFINDCAKSGCATRRHLP